MAITETQTAKKPAGTFFFKEAVEKGLVQTSSDGSIDNWMKTLPGFVGVTRKDIDENTREYSLSFNTFPDYVNYLDELVKHPTHPIRRQWNDTNNIVITSELKNS